jgi:hypothetical protein
MMALLKGREAHRPPQEAVVSVMLFWGIGISILGWLVFKIAKRM